MTPGFTLRTYTHSMPSGETRTRAAVDRDCQDDDPAEAGPETAQGPVQAPDPRLSQYPKFCVHQGPPGPMWTPTPRVLKSQFRMFALWPGLSIQAFITASASAWPRAMFSPPRLLMPAAWALSQGVSPSGSVWSKKPRLAMSSLNAVASAASSLLAVTGVQPALARSTLTSRSTSAPAAASAELGTGVFVFFSGSGVALRDGAFSALFSGVAAGFFSCGFSVSCACSRSLSFSGVSVGAAEAEGDADGS